jgi:hypothetical protein
MPALPQTRTFVLEAADHANGVGPLPLKDAEPLRDGGGDESSAARCLRSRHRGATNVGGRCPVSLDLARPHLGDLRRARSAETLVSNSSHSIWFTSVILLAVLHPIWSGPPWPFSR